MKKKKRNKLVTLPKRLYEAIQSLSLSKSEFNSAIRFIDILQTKSFRKYKLYDLETEISKSYITKAFNGHYTVWLNKLKVAGIVMVKLNKEGKERYSVVKHKCKSYKINTRYYKIGVLMPTDFEITTNLIEMITINSLCPRLKETQSEQGFQDVKEYVKEDLEVLAYNFEKLKEISYKKIKAIEINRFNVNEQIVDEYFQAIIKKGNEQTTYWLTRDNALLIAKKEGLSLIQDHRMFYITDADEFIQLKKQALTASYIGSIDRIEKKYWYADRNDTNNRLDSNITNLCGDLMDEIIHDNNLVQFDLANSQFAILCHILKTKDEIKDTDDFKRFKELSEPGELYTCIEKELACNTKKEAKVMLFELLFSSEKNKSQNKKKVVSLFPSVCKWIDDYKRQYGYEQFPIMLQKEESKMFIDDIWYSLKEKGLFCLTKHDSVIIKKENEEEVETFLKEYFDSINFVAKLVKS